MSVVRCTGLRERCTISLTVHGNRLSIASCAPMTQTLVNDKTQATVMNPQTILVPILASHSFDWAL